MLLFSKSVMGLALLNAVPAAPGGRQEPVTEYQKAKAGLDAKAIRADKAADRMLDVCLPTSRRELGRFTEYHFESTPGYQGMTFVARDGRLRQAVEWSCTFSTVFFDVRTPEEVHEHQDLQARYDYVPFERYSGRWGWNRPPRRLWDPAVTKPGVP